MQQAAQLAYALAVGLTFSGIMGTLIEILVGRRVGFRPPFVTRGKPGRSLALTFVAGPFMLTNEAIAAYRVGVIAMRMLALWATLAVVWCAAAGVLIVEFVLLVVHLIR